MVLFACSFLLTPPIGLRTVSDACQYIEGISTSLSAYSPLVLSLLGVFGCLFLIAPTDSTYPLLSSFFKNFMVCVQPHILSNFITAPKLPIRNVSVAIISLDEQVVHKMVAKYLLMYGS